MRKNITLKEAGIRASQYPQESILKCLNELRFDAPNYLVSVSYMENGEDNTIAYCPSCGAMWKLDRFTAHTCPKCGNSSPCFSFDSYGDIRLSTIASSSRETEAIVLDIDREAGYALIVAFNPAFRYVSDADLTSCTGEHKFDFLKGEWKYAPEMTSYSLITFVRGKGFRNAYHGGLEKGGYYQGYWKSKLSHVHLIEQDASNDLIALATDVTGQQVYSENVFQALSDYTDTIVKSEKAKRSNSLPKAMEALLSYNPHEVTEDEIRTAEKAARCTIGCMTDSFAGTYRYKIYCGNCGKYFSYESNSSYLHSIVCENCGHNICVDSCGRNSFHGIRFFVDPNNNLVEQIFEINEKMGATTARTAHAIEESRVYFTDKKELCFEKTDGQWKKRAVPSYASLTFHYLMQDKDEILNLVQSSVMNRTGLAEAWGLTSDTQMDAIGNYDKNSYAYNCYNHPCLEKFAKTGMTSLVKDITCGRGAVYNENGRSVSEILNVPKPVFRMAREMNLGMYETNELNHLYALDQTITSDDYRDLKNTCQISQLTQLSERFHIPIKKIREYLKSCYDHQCIYPREALTEWSDYLRMADDLEYDLSDKSRKFPQSLKKEHDIAIFAYEKVKDKLSQERFAKQYLYNKKYSYEKGNFVVKIPEKAEDIVAEAKSQHNCVASYVKRVCNGETIVAFVRYKDKPDQSYVTMEILNGEIYQLKAFANAPVKDQDTLDFVHDFAKAKGLALNY